MRALNSPGRGVLRHPVAQRGIGDPHGPARRDEAAAYPVVAGAGPPPTTGCRGLRIPLVVSPCRTECGLGTQSGLGRRCVHDSPSLPQPVMGGGPAPATTGYAAAAAPHQRRTNPPPCEPDTFSRYQPVGVVDRSRVVFNRPAKVPYAPGRWSTAARGFPAVRPPSGYRPDPPGQTVSARG